MNSDRANAIPLALILEKIGGKPARDRTHDATYLSPLRIERTASFQISKTKNVWYDHGIGKGGSVVDFACEWLESIGKPCTVADALRWIEYMAGDAPIITSIVTPKSLRDKSSLLVKKTHPVQHPALVKYLSSRGICLKIASSYLVEAFVHNKESHKDFFALGLVNEEGGYELRNPFFKGCIGTKAISFIRGKQPKPAGVHFFEGMFDYASAISYQGVTRFNDDTIILNSLSCLKQAFPYVKDYGYHVAYTWLDNDDAGDKGTNALTEFFKAENDLQHKPMNSLYRPCKDVNAWHINKLSLSL